MLKVAWIIDDNVETRDVMVLMVRLLGYDGRGFSGARAAAEALIAGEMPDLIFLDINMPGVSGMEFLGFIRSRDMWKTLPVLMLTAESAENMVELAIRLGADGYIFKPINLEELEMAIPVAMQRRKIASTGGTGELKYAGTYPPPDAQAKH